MVLIANDCGYKILRFWANPQKYQTLVPTKNSHLKVTMVFTCIFARAFQPGAIQNCTDINTIAQ
jgi:hypothetical protein